MNLPEISKLRLINQQIATPSFNNPKELANWMGAMQSQDLNMALWAIGLRVKNSSLKQVEDAFNSGEILRTHLMRPTWHIVSSDDIYWMLELTAPRLMNAMKFRDRELGLTTEIFKKTNSIIENSLSKTTFFTRDQISARLNSENIKTDENRLSHLLYHAELSGIICSGKLEKGKQTYTSLPQRVPSKKLKQKEEALADMAKRYFTSHGPATLKDFIWWSGLTATEARKGLISVEKDFISEQINEEKFFYSPYKMIPEIADSLFLLPAYDEFLISYKDRSASLTLDYFKKTISNNGMFYPIIVEDGEVTGIWKRTLKKESINVESKYFGTAGPKTKVLFEKKANEYGLFQGKKAEVNFNCFQK